MAPPEAPPDPASAARAGDGVVCWYSRQALGSGSLLLRWGVSTVALAALWAAVLVRLASVLGSWAGFGNAFATAAFFVAALPATAWLMVWNQRRLQGDGARLAGLLGLDDDETRALLGALVRVPRTQRLRHLAAGAGIGLAHDLALGGATLTLLTGHLPGTALELLASLCTLAIWVLIWDIATQLVGNAQRLAELTDARLRMDHAHNRAAQVLGAIAVRSALPVLVLIAAMPLMLVDGEGDLTATLPGLLASMLLTGGLVSLPLRGLRRSVLRFKARQLEALDRSIASLGALDPTGPRDVERNRARELALLLGLRREIRQLSPWPIGGAGIRALLLYGIIPPLTWVAAALVELGLERWL